MKYVLIKKGIPSTLELSMLCTGTPLYLLTNISFARLVLLIFGVGSMTMSFSLAPVSDVDDLAAGTKFRSPAFFLMTNHLS